MSISDRVIPASKRYGKIKEVIFWLADSVAEVRAKNPNLPPGQTNGFLLLAYPWLAEELTVGAAQEKILGQNRQLLSALGFQGGKVLSELRDVLGNDRHLAECCLTPLRLAQYLDSAAVTRLADARQAGSTEDKLNFVYEEFEMSTYHQGSFKRAVLSHLFNFEMEGDSTTIDDVRIERLAPDTISRILGEPGFHAFLHPSKAGDCFVVAEEGAAATADMEWMQAQRNKVFLFGKLLQFYKDGVVHVGYSALHFSPEWVNRIRKPPLFFLGSTRQVPYKNGSNKWTMMTPDKEQILRWWKAVKLPRIAAALENKSGKLREATYRAGEYFDTSHQKFSASERLIALAISLESLFTPEDKESLSFRISQSVSQFIEGDPIQRQRIFESLRRMYSKRSKLFHGTYDLKKYEDGTFVTDEEIAQWAGYIRRSLLGFLTFISGEKRRAIMC